MTRTKINFSGTGSQYFIYMLGWSVLTVITLGLAIPFFTVWNFKWFATHITLEQE